jgi:hypothetical protein
MTTRCLQMVHSESGASVFTHCVHERDWGLLGSICRSTRAGLTHWVYWLWTPRPTYCFSLADKLPLVFFISLCTSWLHIYKFHTVCTQTTTKLMLKRDSCCQRWFTTWCLKSAWGVRAWPLQSLPRSWTIIEFFWDSRLWKTWKT